MLHHKIYLKKAKRYFTPDNDGINKAQREWGYAGLHVIVARKHQRQSFELEMLNW